MCELFGFCSNDNTDVTELLKTFFARSANQPDGWGLATFHGDAAQIEKEPVLARDSSYLRSRLSLPVEENVVLAHIRRASTGDLTYANTHPFVMRTKLGRAYTLIHNGVIYESPLLDSYKPIQQGECDSELILIHFIQRMNELEDNLGRGADAQERFHCIDDALHEMCPHNKINMVLYDGECFYIHSNLKETLHSRPESGGILVTTKPIDEKEGWEAVPLCRLIAYRNGACVMRGEDRHHEYFKREDDITG